MNKKTALVTGASSGIGAEFCRQLSKTCHKVILVARTQGNLEKVAVELQANDCEAFVVEADLTKELGLTKVVETIRQQGPVTTLVNNAGFTPQSHFADCDLELQQGMIDLHISATLRLCRAAIPFMREVGGGDIINVSSVGAHMPPSKGLAVYCASKLFLNHFSEALALEEAEHNIRVQALCPGYTRTNFHSTEVFLKEARFDPTKVPDELWQTPEYVVSESLNALETGEVVYVPGEDYRAMIAQANASR